MIKKLSELIDELSIVNIKIFTLIDKVEDKTGTVEDARKVQSLNKYRSKLKNAIDEYFYQEGEIKV